MSRVIAEFSFVATGVLIATSKQPYQNSYIKIPGITANKNYLVAAAQTGRLVFNEETNSYRSLIPERIVLGRYLRFPGQDLTYTKYFKEHFSRELGDLLPLAAYGIQTTMVEGRFRREFSSVEEAKQFIKKLYVDATPTEQEGAFRSSRLFKESGNFFDIRSLEIDPNSAVILTPANIQDQNHKQASRCLKKYEAEGKRFLGKHRRRFIQSTVKTMADLIRLVQRLVQELNTYNMVRKEQLAKYEAAVTDFQLWYATVKQLEYDAAQSKEALMALLYFVMVLVDIQSMIKALAENCRKTSYFGFYSCKDIRVAINMFDDGQSCQQIVFNRLLALGQRLALKADDFEGHLLYRDVIATVGAVFELNPPKQ